MKTQSSELVRQAEEKENNEKRHLAWLAKSSMYRYENKHLLDVTDEQDGLNIAQASEENMLLNDPAYQEFIDNVDTTPF